MKFFFPFFHMTTTTTTGILGFNVHMDQNGDAEGNYTLLCLEIVNKSIDMQIVGSFHQTENDLPVSRKKMKFSKCLPHHVFFFYTHKIGIEIES